MTAISQPHVVLGGCPENLMYVQELRVGLQSPDEVDRIIITELPDGQFQFEAVLWAGENKMYFVPHRSFGTAAEAKEVGIEWAAGRGAETLVVEYQNAQKT
jgi:hypothetical protein